MQLNIISVVVFEYAAARAALNTAIVKIAIGIAKPFLFRIAIRAPVLERSNVLEEHRRHYLHGVAVGGIRCRPLRLRDEHQLEAANLADVRRRCSRHIVAGFVKPEDRRRIEWRSDLFVLAVFDVPPKTE